MMPKGFIASHPKAHTFLSIADDDMILPRDDDMILPRDDDMIQYHEHRTLSKGKLCSSSSS